VLDWVVVRRLGSLPPSQPRRLEVLEELTLGVLHLLRRLGIAAHGSDAFQSSQRKSVAQVLGCIRQSQQGLQRS